VSWFSDFLGKNEYQASDESTLVQLEVAIFEQMGVAHAEAVLHAKESIAKAKQTVKERGWDKHPPQAGTVILQREAFDPAVASLLQALRADGVRDTDIRDWWNRPPLERVLVESWHEKARMTAFLEILKQHPELTDMKDVFAMIDNVHQTYGPPSNNPSEDRPLPIELHSRISDWIFAHQNTGRIQELQVRFKTFNAAVRHETREGRL
jgi:hypothetical protein